MSALDIVYFVLGLVALVAGAEALVRGASRLALAVGVSPLVVGLTIVAYGTSAPEIAVSVDGVLGGRSDIAIGNVVGSNIFNILFILGISALIRPLIVHRQIIRQEVPIMFGASVLFVLFALDGGIQRYEAGMLLALLVGYTFFLVRQSRAETKAGTADDSDLPRPTSTWDRHWSVQTLLILAGLGLLILGSHLLVEAATSIARAFGVSDLIIGLTIVAAGTSLPEVATSITAALRGQRDIAVGNVIGSSTFNILGGLGASGLVATSGLNVAPSVLAFDIWFMVAVAVTTLPIFIPGQEITRWNGALLFFYYLVYTVYLVLKSTDHDGLATFSTVMLSFIAPLTVITLVASLIRAKPLATT